MQIDSVLSVDKDEKTHSHSVLVKMTISSYLQMVENLNRLEEQRDVIKTASARTIQSRLVDDLKQGAIIPPIVIGLIVPDQALITSDTFSSILEASKDSASVIDGMQRTEALKKAMEALPSIGNRTLKVEFWISHSVNKLIYRMLVLNTGQQPWSTRKQIEVVYKPLIREVSHHVANCNCITQGSRRTAAGTYPAKDVVEMYLAFGLRKTNYDIQDQLADEFNRLDMIEKSGEDSYSLLFYKAMDMLVRLDEVFSKSRLPHSDCKYDTGFSIFTNTVPKIGFMTALAINVMGRPGALPKSEVEQEEKMAAICAHFDQFVDKLKTLSDSEMDHFLSLDILQECLPRNTHKIGSVERDFFKEGFDVLFKNEFDITSMAEAWRAYAR